ncbi:MAG: hypothetical protein WDW38_008705 [Sanguina aurantia]
MQVQVRTRLRARRGALQGPQLMLTAAHHDAIMVKAATEGESRQLGCDWSPAKALLSGSLLCPRQDATLTVRDFPLDLLQPVYTALPALQRAATTAAERDQQGAFYGLTKRFESTLQNLGIPGMPSGAGGGGTEEGGGLPGLAPQSAVTGQLFVDGSLRGSTLQPEAHIAVRVEDGVLGGTPLSQAQLRDPPVGCDQKRQGKGSGAGLSLQLTHVHPPPTLAVFAVDADQAVSVSLDLTPADSSGWVRVRGSGQVPSSITRRLQARQARQQQQEQQQQQQEQQERQQQQEQEQQRQQQRQQEQQERQHETDDGHHTMWADAAEPEQQPWQGLGERGRAALDQQLLQQEQQQQGQQAGSPRAPSGPRDAATLSSLPHRHHPTPIPTSDSDSDPNHHPSHPPAPDPPLPVPPAPGVPPPPPQPAAAAAAGEPSPAPITSAGQSVGSGTATPAGDPAAAESGADGRAASPATGAASGRRTGAGGAHAGRAARPEAAPSAPQAGEVQLQLQVKPSAACGAAAVAAAKHACCRRTALLGAPGWEEAVICPAGIEAYRPGGSGDCRVTARTPDAGHGQDGGMSLLMSALVPDFEWRGGTADINIAAQGPLSAPTIDGRALLSKATLSSPHLRHPVTGLAADIRFDGSTLSAEHLDATLGPKGSKIHLSGSIPIHGSSSSRAVHQSSTDHPPPTSSGGSGSSSSKRSSGSNSSSDTDSMAAQPGSTDPGSVTEGSSTAPDTTLGRQTAGGGQRVHWNTRELFDSAVPLLDGVRERGEGGAVPTAADGKVDKQPAAASGNGSSGREDSEGAGPAESGLRLALNAVELRVRNVYTGEWGVMHDLRQ